MRLLLLFQHQQILKSIVGVELAHFGCLRRRACRLADFLLFQFQIWKCSIPLRAGVVTVHVALQVVVSNETRRAGVMRTLESPALCISEARHFLEQARICLYRDCCR